MMVRATARVAGTLVLGAVTLWVAAGITLDLAFAKSATDLAQAIWPQGTAPNVAKASSLMIDLPAAPEARINKQRGELRNAVLREPINTEGLGALAALEDASGDSARARALFQLSERLSRRNTLAEFWLIEDAVKRGKIDEAVLHYDRAMRVSVDAQTILLPTLVNASSDLNILKALLPRLAQHPLWSSGYLNQLAKGGDDPIVMSAALRVAPPDLNSGTGRYLAENLLRRMVTLKDGRGAIVAVNRLEGRAGTTRSLQGGDFKKADNVLPFAWWLKDEINIRAYRDIIPTGSMGLRVDTSTSASGLVAQQLIGLASGHYGLQGETGNVSGDIAGRAAIDIACGDGTRLAHFVLPPSKDKGGRFHFSFDVPPVNCAVQSVEISTAPAADTSIWLDNLAIVR